MLLSKLVLTQLRQFGHMGHLWASLTESPCHRSPSVDLLCPSRVGTAS